VGCVASFGYDESAFKQALVLGLGAVRQTNDRGGTVPRRLVGKYRGLANDGCAASVLGVRHPLLVPVVGVAVVLGAMRLGAGLWRVERALVEPSSAGTA